MTVEATAGIQATDTTAAADPGSAADVPDAAPDQPFRPSLSPSRAADFKTCPLLYRFRSIDRIPEPPTPDQARGTLVHAVLEKLFDFPAGERTRDTADGLVEPQWEQLREEQRLLEQMFGPEGTPSEFLSSATDLLGGYFSVEDPRRLEPAERERL